MIVGLTGGMGSGKTTIAKIFIQLGIPVYDSDTEAKRLLEKDESLKHRLQSLLGKELLDINGNVDKAYMADKIFNNEELLSQVNGLIHPAVANDFKAWAKSQTSPYVIKEAAILYESGSYKDCDKVVVVTATEELRVARVMKRSNMEREEVLARMRNQWDQARKEKLSDYLVYNDQTKSVIKQVLKIHEDIIGHTNTRG